MEKDLFQKVEGLDVIELEELKEENERVKIIPTSFGFIQKHKGLRPGCIHTLLGGTGLGKTTFVRSLIHEHIKAGVNVGYYMTEESEEDLRTLYSYKQDLRQDDFNRLRVLEERKVERDRNDYLGWIDDLRLWIIQNSMQVVFLDNLTTSEFYDGRIDNANNIINRLIDLIKETNVALFVVAHTGKNVIHTKIYTTEDLRGHNALALKSHYFYVIHRVRHEFPPDLQISNKEYNFDRCYVVVKKSRNHPYETSKAYCLKFDIGTLEYHGTDEPDDIDVLKELLKEKRKK